MSLITNFAVGIIALLHVYILVLEMFYWDKPAGLKAFDNNSEIGKTFAESSKVLAANQGLYNGFLAAGLCWGIILSVNADANAHAHATSVKVFFLCCVLIAGLYGAATSSSQKMKIKILFSQAVSAILALILVFLS